ncbi:MAG: hypothetical protein ACHQHP_02890 [Bacteroidia bacterium]
MNCTHIIAAPLLLLSLTAGMWLLYKTQKENLSTFFKVVAWFVVISSICTMLCCAMCCAMRCCMMRQECRQSERCEGMGGECGRGMWMGHGGMNKRIIIMRGGDDDECEMEGKCCRGGKEECEEGKEKCCDKDKKCDMKMDMKKDSVVVKKK